MPEFKFQIGDLVMTRVGAEEAKIGASHGEFAVPVVGTITARISEECTAGVQLSYHFSRSGNVHRFAENELMLASEFDAVAHSNAVEAGKQRKRGDIFEDLRKMADALKTA
jgi:hypothetical protein